MGSREHVPPIEERATANGVRFCGPRWSVGVSGHGVGGNHRGQVRVRKLRAHWVTVDNT